MICTIYSHYLVLDKIVKALNETFRKAHITVKNESGSYIINVNLKGSLFSSPKKFKITYRQRNKPSYELPETDDSPLTANLKGLYGFVNSLPTSNENIKNLFLHKILTLNSEFSIQQEIGEIKELTKLIKSFAQDFDAVVFVQPGTIISRSEEQHFLDKNLQLIIDPQGNCEINELDIKIDSTYFDNVKTEVSENQKARKARSEEILEKRNIKINKNLPCIPDEEDVTLRTPVEIAQRVCVLAITNSVAFNSLSNKEAIKYLKEYNLWDYTTSDEKLFLVNPTDEKKNHETWKCEVIWTLMWALKKINEFPFPDNMCSLDDIPSDIYPVGIGKDPYDFINSITESRSKEEILDANDLHYRLDWACVDARINKKEMEGVNQGVVYERHYALNWLINYKGQAWDDVSCDT